MFQGTVCWCGQSYHIRCQERGNHRYGYDDRVEEVADDTQRQTQRGDDEGELTNLCHGESAAHGRLQTLTSQQEGERAKECLTNEDGQHQCDDRPRIADNNLRVYQHTY